MEIWSLKVSYLIMELSSKSFFERPQIFFIYGQIFINLISKRSEEKKRQSLGTLLRWTVCRTPLKCDLKKLFRNLNYKFDPIFRVFYAQFPGGGSLDSSSFPLLNVLEPKTIKKLVHNWKIFVWAQNLYFLGAWYAKKGQKRGKFWLFITYFFHHISFV